MDIFSYLCKMNLSFRRKNITHNPINYWTLSNDTTLVIYQGERGENPLLDFVVKYKQKDKRLRAPSHTHWIVDLIIKSEYNKQRVGEFLHDVLEFYNTCQPFTSVEERDNYQLQNNWGVLYNDLNSHGDFKMDFLGGMIELFCLCEKQTTGAFMFKTLIQQVIDFCEGRKDFFQIIGYSKRV